MENGKSSKKSKLRGTEKSACSRTGYYPDSSYQTHSATSSQNTPNLIESHNTKSFGRGMLIQQMMSQSTTTSTDMSKKTNPSYSNKNIENYFLNLREQKKKEICEENVKEWGKMLHSIRKS